jgi:hypothetical protein
MIPLKQYRWLPISETMFKEPQMARQFHAHIYSRSCVAQLSILQNVVD